jgi:hypothetical protein
MKKQQHNPRKPGPKPEMLKFKGKWENAVEKALKKPNSSKS